ncbi:hypothetical protein GYMLUDRAFT_63871 [Collybiopsis luxurians FD-317 M1]|uniref:Uncharacterized protein n=1 Tax=Collybiopsis luxurians FD-317 M1 TaxID=944289 RepID=A0A0D0ARV8_9AGAR|nr:hypothetical protein GYMLUDRAFT_63871 [Collybiopsis luxurians FD-317 M1]
MQPPTLLPFLSCIKADSTTEFSTLQTRGFSMNRIKVDTATGLLTLLRSEFFTNCIEVFSGAELSTPLRRRSSVNHFCCSNAFRDAATSTKRSGAESAMFLHDTRLMHYTDDAVNLFDPYASQTPSSASMDIATASYCALETNLQDDLSFLLNSYSNQDICFNQGMETFTVNANPSPRQILT